MATITLQLFKGSQQVGTFVNGQTVASDQGIAAQISGTTVTAVKFYVNDKFIRQELNAPYSLGGDNAGVVNPYPFAPGANKLTVEVWNGTKVAAKQDFTVVGVSTIGLKLAKNGAVVGDLLDGQHVQDTCGVVATTDVPVVATVKFYVNGALVRQEQNAPYSLGGDTGNVINPFDFPTGTFKLTVEISDGTFVVAKHEFNLVGDAPAPVPVPTPTPTPTPVPTTGTKVPSGSNIPSSGTILLERGGFYKQNLNPSSNTTIAWYGDTSKPMPVVKGTVQFIGKSGLTIDGIAFLGTGINAHCIRILNSSKVKIQNCTVVGYGGNGINSEGYNGGKSTDIQIRNTVIADNYPSSSGHCEGCFFSYTYGLIFDGNVVSNNGGKPGTETIFNHGVYFHGTCGPGDFTNNLFHHNCSHGLQQRAGGNCYGNLFVDNAVHQSYGLVNDAALVDF